MNLKFNLLKLTQIQLFIIILLTFIAYSNIFQNNFILDDTLFIGNWNIPKSFENIPKAFLHDSVPPGLIGYRPIRAISYMVAYKFFDLNIYGYHLISLITHLLATILVFFITRKIAPNIKYLPFIVAVLFGLHPIHTEAITFITASMDSIGFVFFLASFYFFLRGGKNYILSVIFAFLAIFSNEICLTLPFIIIFYDLLFNRRNHGSLINSKALLYGSYLAIAGFYLLIRMGILGIYGRGEEYLGGSFYLTMLTMTKVIVRYIYLMVWPQELMINQTIPPGIKAHTDTNLNDSLILSQSIITQDVLLSIFIIAFLLILAFWAYQHKKKIITFSIGWFFITLLPVLYIIPQGPIMQERYLYLASFGYILILAWFIVVIPDLIWNLIREWIPAGVYPVPRYGAGMTKDRFRVTITLLLLTLLALFYGWRTYIRNQDFKDDFTLWKNMALQFPSDVQANFITGNYYVEKNQPNLAISHYQKALKIEPDIPEIYFKLGQIYLNLDQKKEAILNFKQAQKLNPDFFAASLELNKLGVKTREHFQKYDLGGFTFFYPAFWNLTEDSSGIIELSDKEGSFGIEISTTPVQVSVDAQETTYGEVISQGLAQIPNFEISYVKFWSSGKLEFFLIKNKKEIKILVSPIDFAQNKLFNFFMGNINVK